MLERRLIAVHGVVQGVGFRPFVHRLAAASDLRGSVRNNAHGVLIDVEGMRTDIDEFCRSLSEDLPSLAEVQHVAIEHAAPQDYPDFRIVASDPRTRASVAATVPPDVATCPACLAELFDPLDRRFGHAFITCTDCGPRFSIVTGAPYDRERTTMSSFAMCAACRHEYDDPTNRRFHAEAIACRDCGPTLRAEGSPGARPVLASLTGDEALEHAAGVLRQGGIVAIKALGGFHLACDAAREDVVVRLRGRKHRPAKPFAMMVRDADAAALLCHISRDERELLESPARPIALLVRRDGAAIAGSVAPGQQLLGLMLPSTPLHHLLMARLDRPLIMTSGNRSDEPVAIDDGAARDALGDIADLFLTHDRVIAVRCDDSVTRFMLGEPRVIRRSRGYVPRTIAIHRGARQAVLALGGQLKNTVCMAHSGRAILSAHVGDLESAESRGAMRDAIAHVSRSAGVRPTAIAHDLHPDYASTRIADAMAGELGIEDRVVVQHHHAHVASCVAEHGVSGPVIGVAFDGAGLGTDGAIWGGEFLLVDGAQFTRCGHLSYVALPGGDAASRRPWRSAAAHLAHASLGGAPKLVARPAEVEQGEWSLVQQMLARDADMPRTSSVGRLFDAVASLTGVCHVSRYEGQAATALEAIADPRAAPRYTIALSDGEVWTADPAELIRWIVDDVHRGVGVAEVAGAFHLALCNLVVRGAERIREASGVGSIVLTGGVFMNAMLLELAADALARARFTVVAHRTVPCNDGGLSLGQAYVAACALEEEAVCA
ncbi:MAG: carbamoyltransferase HypF [Gemmatimonadaceae bacterium]